MTRMPLEERRQRLIDATVAVVAERGVAGATTRAITAQAAMPLASFHYAFASHQELMLATLHRLVDTEVTENNDLTMAGATLEENVTSALTQHLDDVLHRMADHRSLQELLLHVSHLPGHGGLPLRYRNRRVERMRQKLQAVADALGATFPLPVDDLARAMVVVADGVTLALLTGTDPAEVRATLPLLVRLG